MPEWSGSLNSAIERSGLVNGARISVHHHLRSGDQVVGQLMGVLIESGFQNLTLCASSLIGEAGAHVLSAVRQGVISRIETTGLKEPLASAVLKGDVPEPVVFRSHGSRARAINTGRTPIDVAFIAVSAVDSRGCANGVDGPNRFGSIGYGLVDVENAGHVILISDYLSEKNLEYVSIPEEKAEQVVIVPSIGNREVISGGTLRLSRRPIEHLIARQALSILEASGAVNNGMSFQAGSGGVSLLIAGKLADLMRNKCVHGSFASGGATGTLTSMLEEGLFDKIYDVQSFDDEAVMSLKNNTNHIEMSATQYADPDYSGCIAQKLDIMVLSATEVDCEFNVNSLTGSDGRILGALGGAPDTADGAKLTMVVLPSFRGRIPSIRKRVRTICTPGHTVDIIVTERGFCINPLRPDLADSVTAAGLRSIAPEDLMNQVHRITGIPHYPENDSRVAGIVEYIDGNALDRVFSTRSDISSANRERVTAL